MGKNLIVCVLLTHTADSDGVEKNPIIENLIGKQNFLAVNSKNTVLSLLYFREEELFQTHLVQGVSLWLL